MFFCGLTQSHYAWHTLSPSAKVVSIYMFRVMSFLAELLLFLCCGLDLWGSSLWNLGWDTKWKVAVKVVNMTLYLSLIVVISRLIVIVPLVKVINLWRPEHRRISGVNMKALSLAGCTRGAVTLALAVNHFLSKDTQISKADRILSSASILTVVLSTIVLGGSMPAILRHLFNLEDSERLLENRERNLIADDRNESLESTRTKSFQLFGSINLKKHWSMIDKAYLQPVFGGRSTAPPYKSPPPSQDDGEGPGVLYTCCKRVRVVIHLRDLASLPRS